MIGATGYIRNKFLLKIDKITFYNSSFPREKTRWMKVYLRAMFNPHIFSV